VSAAESQWLFSMVVVMAAENKGLFSADFFWRPGTAENKPKATEIAYFRWRRPYFRQFLAAENDCNRCSELQQRQPPARCKSSKYKSREGGARGIYPRRPGLISQAPRVQLAHNWGDWRSRLLRSTREAIFAWRRRPEGEGGSTGSESLYREAHKYNDWHAGPICQVTRARRRTVAVEAASPRGCVGALGQNAVQRPS
jgi:hypothetical protein